jgi:hypothetical protein
VCPPDLYASVPLRVRAPDHSAYGIEVSLRKTWSWRGGFDSGQPTGVRTEAPSCC